VHFDDKKVIPSKSTVLGQNGGPSPDMFPNGVHNPLGSHRDCF